MHAVIKTIMGTPPPPLKMRSFLPPIFSREEKNCTFSSAIGARNLQEDRFSFLSFETHFGTATAFCVLDGHGGQSTAAHSEERLLPCIAACLEDCQDVLQLPQCVSNAFVMCNTELEQRLPETTSGACAVISIIIKDFVCISWIGDCSACIVFEDGSFRQVSSNDHPTNEEEAQRIKKAGGFIHGERVNGILNVSRALGDFELRGLTWNGDPAHAAVTCIPHTILVPRIKEMHGVLLMSDGIEEVIPLKLACEGAMAGGSSAVIQMALDHQCFDNVTAAYYSF